MAAFITSNGKYFTFYKILWLQYIDTLKQELSGTKAYEQTYEKEKSLINNHIFYNATRSVVSVNEGKQRLSHSIVFLNCTNNHKRHDLWLILGHARLPNYQDCLPLVLLLSKTMLLNIVKKSMKGPVKIFFGQSKIQMGIK